MSIHYVPIDPRVARDGSVETFRLLEAQPAVQKQKRSPKAPLFNYVEEKL